jgi:chitinase
VVRDDFGGVSAPAIVTVSFTNLKPVANAGTSQSVALGDMVYLNGSGSTDANGDSRTYSWSISAKPAGSAAAITNPTAAVDIYGHWIPGEGKKDLVRTLGGPKAHPGQTLITGDKLEQKARKR